MAAWWDAKQADTGDLWHRALIDPTVLRVLGDVAGARVLDLACGNGYLARHLARQGAAVTAVDASESMIERARGREAAEPLGISYHLTDAAHLDALADRAFDVVLCNMALMDIADAARAIGEMGRVLGPGGRLVASLSHPCFDVPGESSAWLTEQMDWSTTLWRKVRRYRQTFEAPIPWQGPVEGWTTPAYHRPLSWYVQALRAAGFALTALEEPEPTEEFLVASPSGPWIAEVPLHLVIEATRI
jgi:ubiquinone/menaquinone biosynthesis C-methylase UbiE